MSYCKMLMNDISLKVETNDIKSVFLKLAPHSKLQFENSKRFAWKITWKTDQINFAHFTKDG